MNRILLYASVVGITIGASYWLYKKVKADQEFVNPPVPKKMHITPIPKTEKNEQKINVSAETDQTKSEYVQPIYERHSAAREVMKNAYQDIMEHFVEDFSIEENSDRKGENGKVIIDSEDISVMKKIDSISNELDDLLK